MAETPTPATLCACGHGLDRHLHTVPAGTRPCMALFCWCSEFRGALATETPKCGCTMSFAQRNGLDAAPAAPSVGEPEPAAKKPPRTPAQRIANYRRAIRELQRAYDLRDRVLLLDSHRINGLEAQCAALRSSLEEARKDSTDARRYRALRDMLESSVSASVEVNDQRGYYETNPPGEEVRLQFYPDTPIGFYVVNGSTMDEATDALIEGEYRKDDKPLRFPFPPRAPSPRDEP